MGIKIKQTAMAKKQKGKCEVGKIYYPAPKEENEEFIDATDIERLKNLLPDHIEEDEKDVFTGMFSLALMGVTPEEYAQFYNIFQMTEGMLEEKSADEHRFKNEEEKIDAEDGYDPFSLFGSGFRRAMYDVKEYEPLKDASDKTLVLKIQMKDVTKPPMWREVEVPADYNFEQLHEVIQEVMGLEDYHLWQFGIKAYDDSLVIGLEKDDDDPYSMGIEDATHEADETSITQFLQHKGDKLEYVYDFGDDWIFTVEVKDMLDKKIKYPVCRKFKSELNAIEDFGGIWSYCEAREDLANWNKMTKKEQKQRAEEHGFDSAKDYIEFLKDCKIDLEDLNETLAGF